MRDVIRVLVCDGDEAVRKTLVLTLSTRESISVSEAASMSEAERLLTKEPVDVVLAHHNLPDGSAPQLLERMRKSGLDTPVIVISADDSARDAALAAGASIFLFKGEARGADIVTAVLEVGRGEP